MISQGGRTRRQQLKDDFLEYAPLGLKIRTKAGKILPLTLNKAQRFIHNRLEEQNEKLGMIRAIILKGRQQGCSTYVEGRFYWRVTHRRGAQAFILTHEQDATNNIFGMANRYHQHCPDKLKPHTAAANAKELYFDKLDSGYKVGTAGTKGVGRSSTIQFLHGSEVAFWPNADEHAKGVLQAVPRETGTEVVLESTANGIGNYYHQQWQLAEIGSSDFIPIFVPWYWQDEYTKEPPEDFVLTDEEKDLQELYSLTKGQLAWRRGKIVELSVGGVNGELGFAQEYPCTPTEAFQVSGDDTIISPQEVTAARACRAEKYGPRLLGVDPARFGDDRTSIIKREGRVAFGMKSYTKKDTMEVVGIVHRTIQDYQPEKVFVDVGGLGAGVVDRLWEMGYKGLVVAVNGGEKAMDPEKYANRRAEMWGLMKEWFNDRPAQIPDLDSLHADLCSPRYSFDSKSRLVLERKQDMKKRGIRSPDEGDALALTFAEPVIQKMYRPTREFRPADSVIGY